MVPQEGRLLVGVPVPQLLGPGQVLPDLVRGIGPPEVVGRLAYPHNIVRVVQDVAHVVHIALEGRGDVILGDVAGPLQEVGIPPLVGPVVCRQPRDGGRQPRHVGVDPHGLQGFVQQVLVVFRLNVWGIPLDKADGFIAVGHQEVVDCLVELVEQVRVLLDGVLHLHVVHPAALQDLLGFQPPAILLRQAPLLPAQTELRGCVRWIRPVLDVLRRVLDGGGHFHAGHDLAHGPALNHLLDNRPFLLGQPRHLACAVLEGPHLVVHAVTEPDPFRLVHSHRIKDGRVDGRAPLVPEDMQHVPLRRPVVQNDGPGGLEGVAVLEQLLHLLRQGFVDVGALLPDQIRGYGPLGPVVVRQLHYLVRVHGGWDVLLGVHPRRHAGGEVPLRRRCVQPALRPAHFLSDRLCRPVALDKGGDKLVDPHAVFHLDPQALQGRRPGEVLLGDVLHPLRLLLGGPLLQGGRVLVHRVEVLPANCLPLPALLALPPPLVQIFVLFVGHFLVPVEVPRLSGRPLLLPGLFDGLPQPFAVVRRRWDLRLRRRFRRRLRLHLRQTQPFRFSAFIVSSVCLPALARISSIGSRLEAALLSTVRSHFSVSLISSEVGAPDLPAGCVLVSGDGAFKGFS